MYYVPVAGVDNSVDSGAGSVIGSGRIDNSVNNIVINNIVGSPTTTKKEIVITEPVKRSGSDKESAIMLSICCCICCMVCLIVPGIVAVATVVANLIKS